MFGGKEPSRIYGKKEDKKPSGSQGSVGYERRPQISQVYLHGYNGMKYSEYLE